MTCLKKKKKGKVGNKIKDIQFPHIFYSSVLQSRSRIMIITFSLTGDLLFLLPALYFYSGTHWSTCDSQLNL